MSRWKNQSSDEVISIKEIVVSVDMSGLLENKNLVNVLGVKVTIGIEKQYENHYSIIYTSIFSRTMNHVKRSALRRRIFSHLSFLQEVSGVVIMAIDLFGVIVIMYLVFGK